VDGRRDDAWSKKGVGAETKRKVTAAEDSGMEKAWEIGGSAVATSTDGIGGGGKKSGVVDGN